MEVDFIFQCTASTIGLGASAASLILWALSIETPNQSASRMKILIPTQATIGGIVALGSLISIPLSVLQANPDNDSARFGLQMEIGAMRLLMTLNEYLNICALQPQLTHLFAIFFTLISMTLLSLAGCIPEHGTLYLLSLLVINFFGLSFVYVQMIRLWVISTESSHMHTGAFRLFWRYPFHPAKKHQRALWVASIVSIGLFSLLLSSTILACVKPYLWTQLTMLQVAVISLRRIIVSIYLSLASGTGTQEQQCPGEILLV